MPLLLLVTVGAIMGETPACFTEKPTYTATYPPTRAPTPTSGSFV